jgi:RNA polymerase sigma-70 factor (ECF subfamily)
MSNGNRFRLRKHCQRRYDPAPSVTDRGQSSSALRPVLYCLVPRDLAPRLHDVLRRHFELDPAVEVIVERRRLDRRRAGERRSVAAARGEGERRRIRGAGGRRIADRRAVTVASAPAELPRRARPYADRLLFVERLEPASAALEDIDTARLVTRIQAGERDQFDALYMRYFARVHSYMRVALKDPAEAEDATQQVFFKIFEALPGYEHGSVPFRGWMFAIARNLAIRLLERGQRVTPVDPVDLERSREQFDEEPGALPALDWISDRELMMFIERLPLAQRQVLFLRHMVGLSGAEIARVLDLDPGNVRMLHSRALRFLRVRLTNLGRTPTRSARRTPVRRCTQPAHVLRSRRFAMLG